MHGLPYLLSQLLREFEAMQKENKSLQVKMKSQYETSYHLFLLYTYVSLLPSLQAARASLQEELSQAHKDMKTSSEEHQMQEQQHRR